MKWVKVTQLCPTLCDPMDYIVHEVLQARILEWVAIPSPGDRPNPGTEPRSPTLQADSLPAEPQGTIKYSPNSLLGCKLQFANNKLLLWFCFFSPRNFTLNLFVVVPSIQILSWNENSSFWLWVLKITDYIPIQKFRWEESFIPWTSEKFL